MGYQNRRYSVIDGKLQKRWDATPDPRWFVTKEEAWEADAANRKTLAARMARNENLKKQRRAKADKAAAAAETKAAKKAAKAEANAAAEEAEEDEADAVAEAVAIAETQAEAEAAEAT